MRCIARKSEVRSPQLIYQCVAAPNNRSVPRELSTSFFLISSRIISASERKGLNDSRAISGDFRTFCLPSARPLDRARSPRKDEDGKNKSTTSVNGNVAAAWLVKEFSAGCGTRSFLGDDVLKFTVGVRSSLLLTGSYSDRTSSKSDFYSVRSCPERASSKLENSLRRNENEFVISKLVHTNCIRESLDPSKLDEHYM